MSTWDELSLAEKAEMISVAVRRGYTNLSDIRDKYNEFAEGGNTDDDLVDWIIREEGFIGSPQDIGDGKMTLGSGLTAQKWHDQYKRNGNRWTIDDNRRAVKEEVANRRKWAERNIPNWDSLPPSSQKALLSYKYNYDFNRANSPKLFKALADSNLQEAARQMDATSSNAMFRKGLQSRRQREQEWFLRDVASPQMPNTFYQPAVSTQVYNPYVQEVESTRMLPMREPDPNSYIRTREVSPQEQRRRRFQENLEAYQRFNTLMDMIDIKKNQTPSYVPNHPLFELVNGLAEGGDTKQENSYPIGGPIPVINVPSAIKGAVKEIRQRLYDNITPFGYHNPISRTLGAVALNQQDDTRTEENKRIKNSVPEASALDAIWATYLNIPENQRRSINSKYGISKTKGGYYRFNSPGMIFNFEQDLSPHGLFGLPGRKAVMMNGILGNYTIGLGRDAKGDYIFYSDSRLNPNGTPNIKTGWDINPYSSTVDDDTEETTEEHGQYGQDKKDLSYKIGKTLFGNVEDISMGIGTPVPIYDKIYLDDYYGVPRDPSTHYLPEVTVTGKKHSIGGPLVEAAMNEYKKGGPIHIKPENRGKFTALKERTGHSATWFKEHGTPAQKKMATFALNARHWRHDDGGWLESLATTASKKVMDYIQAFPANPFTYDWQNAEGDGIAQDTYLLPRKLQEKEFLRKGYIKGKNKDYGLVKKAVGDRDLPVYQTAPDAITRDKLILLGNDGYYVAEHGLEHPGSHPLATYTDGHGNFYQKAWDLNDYGGEGGSTESIAGKLLDMVGSPVVVTTGYQKIKDHPWQVGALKGMMAKKGLVPTEIDGKTEWTLPEVTVVGKKKKAFGGNLFGEAGQMQIGRPYYSYDETGRKVDDTLNFNVTLPEITIIPDSQKSPAERMESEQYRRRYLKDYDEYKSKEYTQKQIAQAQRDWNNSTEKKALDLGIAAADGIGMGTDLVSKLPVYSTLRGATILSRAETPIDYVEGGLWLSPIGGQTLSSMYYGTKHLYNNILDLAALKKFNNKYGYSAVKPKNTIVFNDKNMDRVFNHIVNRHNTFLRGVNPYEAHRRGELLDMSPDEAAKYSLTHIHKATKGSDHGLIPGENALYLSNDYKTALMHTDDGEGYIGIVRRPIKYGQGTRREFLEDNDFIFSRPKLARNMFSTTDEPNIPWLTKDWNAQDSKPAIWKGKQTNEIRANDGAKIVEKGDPDFRHYLIIGDIGEEPVQLLDMFKPKNIPIAFPKKMGAVGFSRKKNFGGFII